MGLDATLVLTTLVTATALTPVSAPLFAYAFIGPALTLSPLALGLKLFAILAGSLVAAVIIRRFAGLAAIRRYNDQIDGMNILLVFFFVAAVMENVAGRFWADPLAMIELTALAFAVTFGKRTRIWRYTSRPIRTTLLPLAGLVHQHFQVPGRPPDEAGTRGPGLQDDARRPGRCQPRLAPRWCGGRRLAGCGPAPGSRSSGR